MSADSLIKAQKEHMKTVQRQNVSSDFLVELFGIQNIKLIASDKQMNDELNKEVQYEDVVKNVMDLYPVTNTPAWTFHKKPSTEYLTPLQ